MRDRAGALLQRQMHIDLGRGNNSVDLGQNTQDKVGETIGIIIGGEIVGAGEVLDGIASQDEAEVVQFVEACGGELEIA